MLVRTKCSISLLSWPSMCSGNNRRKRSVTYGPSEMHHTLLRFRTVNTTFSYLKQCKNWWCKNNSETCQFSNHYVLICTNQVVFLWQFWLVLQDIEVNVFWVFSNIFNLVLAFLFILSRSVQNPLSKIKGMPILRNC